MLTYVKIFKKSLYFFKVSHLKFRKKNQCVFKKEKLLDGKRS